MSNKPLKVNWTSLKQMSKNSVKNSTEFKEARDNYLDIINSLDECWEGKDASAFKNNCSNYLASLEKDILYFDVIGQYFDKSADAFSNTIDRNVERVNKVNDLLENDVKNSNFINSGIGGVNDDYY